MFRKRLYILAEGLRELGFEPRITLDARLINESQPDIVIKYIKNLTSRIDGFNQINKITLLGLAFKGIPSTDDLRGTMAKPIFESLINYFPKASYYGYDAHVSQSNIAKFGMIPVKNLKFGFDDADLVLILNNHPNLKYVYK